MEECYKFVFKKMDLKKAHGFLKARGVPSPVLQPELRFTCIVIPCSWLVRVTLVVAYGFFAPKFWEVAGEWGG